MTDSLDPSDTLDQLIDAAADDIEPERRALFERFAACLLRGVDTHHIGGEPVLAAMAAEAFEWIGRRAPDETRVRVRNPLDRPGHTVIEILRDDQPFIVDSLRLEVRRRGVQERNVIHPLLPVERDAQGRLSDILETTNGISLESYVYVEIVPALRDEAACEELAASLRQVMGWISELTSDHRRMIMAIRELMANLEFASPAIEGGKERADKVRRFLDWIADGRFVFVGMRRYQLDEVEGEFQVRIEPETGLGMWRDDSTSRLFEPRRGEDVPSDLREELEDRRIILISKSYMESRIHRHGRLDRIMVKEHDDKGRVTGFTI
ncbi:MAG: NAD-glutamate dehydrogenase, partial [Deltaproteobacteria bacterium]|nr:NAD-glutamate dehydrogenase [Deltaproteobacteria bacterium]